MTDYDVKWQKIYVQSTGTKSSARKLANMLKRDGATKVQVIRKHKGYIYRADAYPERVWLYKNL